MSQQGFYHRMLMVIEINFADYLIKLSLIIVRNFSSTSRTERYFGMGLDNHFLQKVYLWKLISWDVLWLKNKIKFMSTMPDT
jgi:hypothetical protein